MIVLQEQIEKVAFTLLMSLTKVAFLEAVTKMALGNNIGVKFDKYAERAIFQPALGSFIVEVDITAVNHLFRITRS